MVSLAEEPGRGEVGQGDGGIVEIVDDGIDGGEDLSRRAKRGE